MARIYKLSLSPVLLTEGPDAGHLDYVKLTATSPDNIVKVFSIHSADLRGVFLKLVPAAEAATIIGQLRKGGTINLPGPFNTLQLAEIGFRL
jgi:hypothetical protein